ncbi:ATP-binding cassette domain-containing protein [Microbacterium sp. 18062]|uniref:ATP-binding cassette domain-containing protein n=1 Tax=Microbacterium sp. 18062 TaxID=2681410 RepID=UPI00190FADD2|nr:ATP-binding cassette domain-containing protein [Microbacterium sp. 18062]
MTASDITQTVEAGAWPTPDGSVPRSRLRLQDVSKSFGPVQALSHVTFEVAAGEIHGLIGENGAGKSTLMAVASGALHPDTGTVAIDGDLVEGDPSLSRSLGLAIVRQHPALLPELTVADNLLFGLDEKERSRISNPLRWARDCLAAWDDRPDIDPSVRVATLNPEQKFVIEISRALSRRPGVLVLDEPSEHLGAEGVGRLFAAVRKLAADGTAVVYISHRIREIQEISDRVTVLRDGVNRGTRITAELSEAEIVGLIVGRSFDATFPDKLDPVAFAARPTHLRVTDLNGEHFSDVSFEIRVGEIVGLAGIDDNGQADIARALAGLQPSTGTVSIDSRVVSTHSPRTAVRGGIVYIPADRHKEGVFSELSVRTNMTIRAISRLARFGFVSSSRERVAAEETIARFSVKTASVDSPISSLSGGNQQKVVMGGALLTHPDVVVADQPTQGVDVGAKAEIYAHLREIADGGSSVLVLSSDNTELAGLCDRVLVVSRGRIVAAVEGHRLSEQNVTDEVLRAESQREHVRRKPRRWARLADHDLAPVPVLTVLVVGLSIFTQFQNANYLSERNIGTVLSLAAVLMVVAAGQSVVMLRGGIDLSVGPVMSIAVVIGSFYIVDGVPVTFHALGWVLILLVSAAVGVVNWALIDRLKVHPVLATFATWMLLESIALTLRPTPSGLIASSVVSFLSQRFGFVPLALLAAIVVIAGLEFWRTRTTSGTKLLAAGDDADTAAKLGVGVSRTAFIAYVGCSLLAGVAGILLIGRVGSGDPTAGDLYTLQSVAAAVVGGMSLFGGRGSFIGVAVAAVLLTQVRSATTFLSLSDAWQNILLALVTIGAVFVYSIARRRTRS